MYDGSGNPLTYGSVTFTPNAALTDTTDHYTVSQAPVTVNLLDNPLPTVKLLATDNSALSPSGWSWRIAGTYAGAPASQTYLIAYANGATQYLSALLPTVTVPTVYSAVMVSGTPTAGQVITATSGTTATWQATAAKRVTTLTVSSATYTPSCTTTDIALITTPAANFTVASPTGTPADGQQLMIRILSGSTAYTPSWGTAYSGSTAVPLPSSCTVSATDYLGFAWNAAASKWNLLSYAPGY